MIAALPMYDRPELSNATDRFWALIRDGLRTRGIAAPDALTRGGDPWEVWTDPDLLLSQTCGLPYRARLHQRVRLVGTPDYGLPGCAVGYYHSVIVAKGPALPDRPRVAVNDPMSQSGWAALCDWAAKTGLTLGPVQLTGSHAASARAVHDGAADIAALDAQTWRILERVEDRAQALTVIDRTPATPGLPLITATHRDPEPLRAAVSEAIAALSPTDRGRLNLKGLAVIPSEAYLALPVPPKP